MALFKCEFGELQCVPVDMKGIRAETAVWEQQHPAPTVPLIAQETFEAVVSGRGVDMLPNPGDKVYKKQLAEWEWQRRLFMENKMFGRSIQFQGPDDWAVLALVMTDTNQDSQRFRLFRFIIDISEVTEEAVETAGRRFRLHLERQTALRLAHKIGQGQGANRGTGLSGGGRTVRPAGLESGQVIYSAAGRINRPA